MQKPFLEYPPSDRVVYPESRPGWWSLALGAMLWVVLTVAVALLRWNHISVRDMLDDLFGELVVLTAWALLIVGSVLGIVYGIEGRRAERMSHRYAKVGLILNAIMAAGMLAATGLFLLDVF